jgi:hypothetical protein
MVVQGITIITNSDRQLRGDGGRLPSAASLKVKGASLGSGILLGITVATKPGTAELSAIGFSFLRMPVSSAITVDMPKIDIDKLVFKPQVSIESSIKCAAAPLVC